MVPPAFSFTLSEKDFFDMDNSVVIAEGRGV